MAGDLTLRAGVRGALAGRFFVDGGRRMAAAGVGGHSRTARKLIGS